jgi:hypothetical protein
MIKWEHSVFALPFALTAVVLSTSGWPPAWQLCWIVVCMMLARSAGMAFNRWADAELDARNPRTKTRALPAGHLSKGFVSPTDLSRMNSAFLYHERSYLCRLLRFRCRRYSCATNSWKIGRQRGQSDQVRKTDCCWIMYFLPSSCCLVCA